ncbi:MAG: DUF4982 domain-containing protein [Lachnospiraceae bacterium]|nr:DUF4982 domain-containing protein [Lachnospiraceae bacterium]
MSLCLFTNGWEFCKCAVDATIADVMRVWDKPWSKVNLPHDWLIGNVKDLYESATGWYRRTFSWDMAEHADDRLSIRFEGVYMDSAVYVNGKLLGEWKYGYSTFEFDMTSLLTDGENTILVRSTNQSPNSRWYSGAGIYRNVYLRITPMTRIAADGICFHARKCAGNEWTVDYRAELENILGIDDLSLHIRIFEKGSGKMISETTETSLINDSSASMSVTATSISVIAASLSVTDPVLWDVDHPFLYTLETELYQGNKLLDSDRSNLGFRTAELDHDKGFFLNGRHLKLQGVCEHHDLGALGAAFNRSAMARKMRILKTMGVNAIRTSHNMPAPEFMELADEMGFLVVSEAFDMWIRPKTAYDYARFFPEWMKTDIASWVRRDRNHPSLIFWSIGNEIYDMHGDATAPDLTEEMANEVRRHDIFGHGYVTFGSNYMPWEGAQRCGERIKVVGYNYGEILYDEHHKKYPDWFIYGSETASVVYSRGIYHFPLSQSVLSDDDLQCSALGNSCTSWGAKNSEYTLLMERDHPFSLGQFIWTGFDYIGEPTPYHTKNSYFGQIDTAGFKKDAAYIYQAGWTDPASAPFVHVLPYWDFNEGQKVDVRVISNAAAVELFVNGISQGRVAISRDHGTSFGGDYRVEYHPGEITGVAYDASGAEVARETRHSFGDAARLVLEAEEQEKGNDGTSLIFVQISAVDCDGYPVENAGNRVQVTVSGPGHLIGLDNGDSTDYDEYKSSSRKMFSGKLLAIIAPELHEGTICVRAVSGNLASAEVQIPVQPVTEGLPVYYDQAPVVYSDACSTEGLQDPLLDPVPVRKITLRPVAGEAEAEVDTVSNDAGITDQNTNASIEDNSIRNLLSFGPGRTSRIMEAVISPANASFSDLKWRPVLDGGATANMAAITPLDEHGHRALVEVKGDGDFRIRVTADNDQDHVEVMSHLECHAEGLGTASTDPYTFVVGSTYRKSSGNLGNGNERGYATANREMSYAAFTDCDFGLIGSDEVTIPIFELGGNPIELEFYDGIPGQGGDLIGIGHYHKNSIWNTYQPETFRLTRKMKGLRTFSILMRDPKIHIKGFLFTKPEKAYERLKASDRSSVYGDSYTPDGDALTGIGNNVSVVFEDMDFLRGLSRVTICGRAPKSANTIHIRFSTADGECRRVVEFPQCDEYSERSFALEPFSSEEASSGPVTVTWVFLPGSCFDLAWFKFEE